MKIYSWLWEDVLILFVNVPKRIMKISALDELFMFNAIIENLWRDGDSSLRTSIYLE